MDLKLEETKVGRKLGKFTVSEELFHSEEFSRVLAFMTFVPARVEARYDIAGFEYIGLSHLFREVPLGEVTPEYRITVSREDDIIIVEAEEI